MVARIQTIAFQGIDPLPIDVQVQMSNGLPCFTIVGLPDKAVAESRERIRSCFHSLCLSLPPKRITVNLAPADIQKEGSHYDLPMALGLMVAMGILDQEELSSYYALGELCLDGAIAHVSGVLPAAVHAHSEEKGIICPEVCHKEAAWSGNPSILAAPHLMSIVNHLKGKQFLPAPSSQKAFATKTYSIDMKDIKGQLSAKRALEIAACGHHNLLLIGPPGAGKSMLAERLPTILPPLNPEEALEVTMIHSVAGLLPQEGLIYTRPYRDPHYSSSLVALIGGGTKAKPGEISLAHRGVLFLDEFPEFNRSTLEALRQPLETGRVVIARANAHITYPAKMQLIAAMNPCRCGYFGSPERECTKAPRCAEDYQSKISGPLLDRLDLVVDVPEIHLSDLIDPSDTVEDSATIAQRVLETREIQLKRSYKLIKKSILNDQADTEFLQHICSLTKECQNLLTKTSEKLKISGRGYHRILRVARTIADMEEAKNIASHHLAEAIQYR